MLPYLAIAAGVHLAVLFGFAYDYVKQDIAIPASASAPAQSIKAVVKTNESADDSAIMAAEAVTPANAMTEAAGPYSVTFKSSNGTYTAQGADLAELLVSMKYCPSTVCNSSYNDFVRTYEPVKVADTYTNIVTQVTGSNTITSPSSSIVVDSAGTTMRKTIHFAAPGSTTSSRILYVAAGNINCPDGYTYNPASTAILAGNAAKCELSNVQAAQTTSAKNGVCYIEASGAYDQTDPDCQAIAQNGNLQSVPGGVQLRDHPVSPTVATTITSQQGQKMISLLEKMADGSYRRDDTTVSAAGTIGATAATHYPNSPPPAYPGDATGIGSGGTSSGSSSGVSGGTCGGPGQPACSVKIEGDGDGEGGPDFSAAPGPGFGEAFGDLGNSTVQVSNVCPRASLQLTIPFPAPIGDAVLDGGAACDIVGDYGELIRKMNIIFGFIGATFIILRA